MEFDNVGHVDSEILNQVFEPWVRGDQSRNSEGSGLGLSIVHQAIQLHGGVIAMHNTEDGHVVVSVRW
jgi:signal transduction histidine kinase